MSFENTTSNFTTNATFKGYPVSTNRFYPVVIYLVLIILTGIVGNIHVLLVFSRKYKKNSTYRIFVLFLACIDLIVCVVCIPFDTLNFLFLFIIPEEICKVMQYISSSFTVSSVFILVIIAIERYRRVCYPLARQCTTKCAKKLCMAAVLISIVICLPNIWITGVIYVYVNDNTRASKCMTPLNMFGTPLHIAFTAFFAAIFCISTVALMFIYVIIRRRIKNRGIKKQSMKYSSRMEYSSDSTSCQEMYTSETDGEAAETKNEQIHKRRFRYRTKSQTQNQEVSFETDTSTCTLSVFVIRETRYDDVNSKRNLPENSKIRKQKYRKPKKSVGTGKCTRIMFFITATFILSYFPTLIIDAVGAVAPHLYQRRFGDVTIVLIHIAWMSFCINCVSNPIIYCFCDAMFRKEVIQLYNCKRQHVDLRM